MIRGLLGLILAGLGLFTLGLAVALTLGDPGSPILSYLSAGRQQTGLIQFDLRQGLRVELSQGLAGITTYAWSPDGQQLAFVRFTPEGARIVHSSDNLRTQREIATLGQIESLSWSPDGSQLLIVSNQGGTQDLYLLDLMQDSIRRLLPRQRALRTQSAWSPDGQRIAFVQDDGAYLQILIADADGASSRAISTADSWTISPAWSPSGDKLAYVEAGFEDFRLWVYETDSESTRPVMTLLNPLAYGWDTQRDQIYGIVQRDDRLRDLLRVNPDGGQPQILAEGLAATERLQVSPDGRWLAFEVDDMMAAMRTTLLIYRIADGQQRLISESDSGLLLARWRP